MNSAAIAFFIVSLAITAVGGLLSIIALIKGHKEENSAEVFRQLKVVGGSGLGLVVVGLVGAGLFYYWFHDDLVPAPRFDKVFETPLKHLYCGTFKDSSEMGCVLRDHDSTWGKPCIYVVRLGASGKPRLEECADEQDLVGSMYGSENPSAEHLTEYDKPIFMGVASCVARKSNGVTCVNRDGLGFVLGTHEQPRLGLI